MLNIVKSVLSLLIVSVLLISTVNASEPSLRGKIITDDNVTVIYSQQIYKLTYYGAPCDKSKIKNLLETINKKVPINIKNALYRYFRDPAQKYKVVLYSLTKANVITIKNILTTTVTSKGFSFVLSGERRVYPYGKFLTPVLGYNRKRINKENYTYLKGINGLEKEYAGQVVLNIDFQMQQRLEKELYELKALYDAKEVVSVIIDTDTFAVKAFASSNRYNPNNIKRRDIANLQIHAISYLFQLNQFGTIVKDLLYLNAKNPKYQIYADLELDKPSGIDLPYEVVNYNNKVQGFKNYKVNFMQLVKAYIPFYSGGYIADPKIAKGKTSEKEQIISKELAKKMKKEAKAFFAMMPGKKVTLEFKDYNLSVAVYMKDFLKNKHHYMQGYFTIYKNSNLK